MRDSIVRATSCPGRPRACVRRTGLDERKTPHSGSWLNEAIGIALVSWQIEPNEAGRCLGETNPPTPATVLAKRTHRRRPLSWPNEPNEADRCLGRTNPTGPAAVLAERTQRDRPLFWPNEPNEAWPLCWRNEPNGADRCLGRTNPTGPAAGLAERTQRGRPLSWPNEPNAERSRHSQLLFGAGAISTQAKDDAQGHQPGTGCVQRR